MSRIPTWRVRVRRAIQDWVDVDAATAAEAEDKANDVPGVISVFKKSAVRGDLRLDADRPPGVRDDE